MKILISNPPWEMQNLTGIRAGSRWSNIIPKKKKAFKEKYIPFPFDMAYAAAVLEKHGFKVSVIDALAEEVTTQKFLKKVANINPDLLVLSCSTPSIYHDYKIAKSVKSNVDTKIAFFGSHVSARPKEVLGHSYVDFGLIGEYDFTLLELVEALQDGQPLKNIKGLSYRENGKVKVNKRRPLLPVDELPLPAWYLFDIESYNHPICQYFPNFQLITSRGCPFSCIFCVESCITYGPYWRPRSIDLVLEEIEAVIDRYSPKQLWFDDSVFTVDKKRIIKLCKAMNERGIDIPWGCMTGVTIVDEKLLKVMKDAGCIRICYGIESGSEEILKKVGKPYTLKTIEDALRLTKTIGMSIHVTSMFGLPGETKETANKTIDFIIKLGKAGLIDSIQSSIATPYPGTKFFDIVKNNGWLISEDWGNYDGNFTSVVSYSDLSNHEIEQLKNLMFDKWAFEILNRNVVWGKIKTSFRKMGLLAFPFLLKKSFQLLAYQTRKRFT